jgi:flagellar hook-basal body complex protein FliE
MAISSIRQLGTIDPGRAYGVGAPKPPAGPSFATKLQEALQTVDSAQVNKDRLVAGALTGEVTEVHDVMAAAEEAQLTFELMLELRNKLLESYQQIMQMQM